MYKRQALVTGGARGVGAGITDRLLAAGATVVVCGRTDPGPGALPDGVAFHACDVTDHTCLLYTSPSPRDS